MPAFPGGYDLEEVEAVRAGVADGSEPLSAKVAAVRLAGVLKDEDAVFLRDLHDFVHRGWEALDMNRDDGFRVRGYLSLDILRVYRQRLVAVGYHRNRAGRGDGYRCRDISVRRDDDLVARSDAHSDERRDERRLAARHADGVCGAELLTEFVLKVPDLLSAVVDLEERSAPYDSRDCFYFFFSNSVHDDSQKR